MMATMTAAGQAGQLIVYATDHQPRLEPLITVALMTGLRLGELASLTWGSVDLVRGALKVERTLQRVGGVWTFTEPKTKRSARSLALPDRAMQALRRQQDRRHFEEVGAKARWSTAWDGHGGLEFRTAKGTPIEPSNLNGQPHKLLDGIAVPRQGIHSLRHACASMMVAEGIPLRSVMEQLGHSQISLTAATYTHLVPFMLRVNADALDRAMLRA